MNPFNRVPTAKVPRSAFNLSSIKKYTGTFGKIYPLFSRYMIPGDVFRISAESFLKFMPTVNPIFHEIIYTLRAFFCPLRLLDENFEDTITGGEDGLKPDGIFPRWNPSKTAGTSMSQLRKVCGPDTLWDFFGYPLIKDSPNNYRGSLTPPSDSDPTLRYWDDECMPLAYKYRSYWKIWNDWFRDEERQAEIPINEDHSLAANYWGVPAYVNWDKDYFTSSGLQEQRGIAPALPLSGTIPVIFGNNAADNWFTRAAFRIEGNSPIGDVTNPNAAGDWYSLEAGTGGTVTPIINKSTLSDALLKTTGTVNLANAGTFTIPDIRFTSAVQKWMERNEECGSRYGEYLRSMYGVYPKDERLQRPEYIGGSKSVVSSSAVIQTSSSVSGSPQGNETGRLTAMNKSYIGTYKAYEFGVLMIVGYIKPKNSYVSQGFPAEDLISSRYEFPNPLFAHVGNVPIKMGELYARGFKSGKVDPQLGDDTVFGWQGKDDAWRTGRDESVSGFRSDTFYAWTFDRYFTNYPANNDGFIQCHPTTNVQFAVADPPHFASYTGFDVKAIRPLPKFPVPILS